MRQYPRLTVSILVFLLAVFLFSENVCCASNGKPITVVFLYDDVSALSSMDIEAKVIDTFRKYDTFCTFGIIPYVCLGEWRDTNPQDVASLPPEKIKIMKTAIKTGTLEVIQHGFSHQAISKSGYCGYTEFCGLHYDAQEKKIAKGKSYLEKQFNIAISTFYPTWNSYDSNTIRVLENLKFKTFFGMEYGYAKDNLILNFIPFTCDFLHIHNAVKSARKFSDHQSAIVVLVRERDLLGLNKATGEPRFEEFVKLISWITSQKDINVRTITRAVTEIEDLSASRFLTYNSYLKLTHYLYPLIPPLFLNKMFPLGVYLSSKNSNHMKKKIWTFILSFYPAIFIITLIISLTGGRIIFPIFRFSGLICMSMASAGLFLVAVYALRKLDFSSYKLLLETTLYGYRHHYYKFAVLIVALFGANVGIWISWRKSGGN